MSWVRWFVHWVLGADSEEARSHEAFNAVVAAGGYYVESSGGILLDIGARDAAYTERFVEAIRHSVARRGAGTPEQGVVVTVDVNTNYLIKARTRFPCVQADIERHDWPFRSGIASCVVLNQLLEHLKDPFHVLAEADRILRVSGILLIGVPNLAGLVNRLYLLCGCQPPAVHFPGPHVRGFTFRALASYLKSNPNFVVVRSFGACCYPLPPPLSEWLGRIFPSCAAYIFFVARKVADVQPSPWLAGREVTGETVFSS